MPRSFRHVVALSGGVGGARLVHGLARALPEGALSVIVNTGDDLRHWGLDVCPDLDTVMYTLADLAPVERGWGLAEESFAALSMMERYAGPAWFALGDRDLATHLVRSEALRAGESLTSVTARLCAALGVRTPVLPMSDARRPTSIETRELGTLGFQDWLVRHRGVPAVRAVRFDGPLEVAPAALAALAQADLIVIGPSNPYVSVDPILVLPGVRATVAARPVVAVSPIVGGAAVKGPLAAMLQDLDDRDPSARAVADHYGSLVRDWVVERGDEAGFDPAHVLATDTLMSTREASLRLARDVLAFAAR